MKHYIVEIESIEAEARAAFKIPKKAKILLYCSNVNLENGKRVVDYELFHQQVSILFLFTLCLYT